MSYIESNYTLLSLLSNEDHDPVDMHDLYSNKKAPGLYILHVINSNYKAPGRVFVSISLSPPQLLLNPFYTLTPSIPSPSLSCNFTYQLIPCFRPIPEFGPCTRALSFALFCVRSIIVCQQYTRGFVLLRSKDVQHGRKTGKAPFFKYI